MHLASSEYDSEHGNINHFKRKSSVKNLILKPLIGSGSSLHEFEMFSGFFFSLKNFLHYLKEWRDDLEITKKLFFCFIFGLKICNVQYSQNIRDYPLNHSLNARCLRMPYGSVVSRRFYKDQ